VANFPNLTAGSFAQTSPADLAYNCIAWALERDTSQWWQPGGPSPYYWPIPTAPRTTALTVYFEGFAAVGYRRCRRGVGLPGWQIIAIYSDHGRDFMHVAALIPGPIWSSKLGKNIDISHASLHALEGGEYGQVTHFMRRLEPNLRGTRRLLARLIGFLVR